MSKAIYNSIDKYVIFAVCREPMHVGSSSGEKGEVLIHPVDNVPFIQASGICGVLRSYCLKITDKQTVQSLFGDSEENQESKIKVTDGRFSPDQDVRIELRPRVKISSETGAVSSAQLKGEGSVQSGQKFDMQYVAAGAEFSFEIYIYGGNDEARDLIQKTLAAINDGEIQIGGQKSNGCGYIGITNVLHRCYDMMNAEDRKDWVAESGLVKIDLPELSSSDYVNAYDIVINASTENELLVKGIAVEDFGKDAPKAENIKNAEGEYIIPGSSIKGAIRNRMEMIADYMHLNPSLISDGFGEVSDSDISGMTGNLRFRDVIVGNDSKDNNIRHTRIHIDKLTGGVINGALFSELNVFGDLGVHIQIANQNHPEAVAGLLLLALRDLACKSYALGSGQNVGKGYVNVSDICIVDRRSNKKCQLKFSSNQQFDILEGKEILDECMTELQSQLVA